MGRGMELAKQTQFKIVDDQTVTRENDILCRDDELIDKCRQYFPKEALIVAWQINTAVWARWDGKDWRLADGRQISPEYVQELRIFNDTAELRLQRTDRGLQGRYIHDGGPEKSMYVDAFARLFGKCAAMKDGFAAMVDEGRQTKHFVPVEIDKDEYCGLITRNYIEEVGNMGQLSYTDYRFVALEKAE